MLTCAPDAICASPYGIGSERVRTPSTVNALPGRPDPYYAGQKAQQLFLVAAKTIPVAHVYSSDYPQMNSIMQAAGA